MKVTIIQAPSEPFILVGTAAGICYGKDAAKEEPEKTKQRALRCYRRGHESVWEHAVVTFKVEGISRACSHQLVRHRLASFCQESQRYVNYSSLLGHSLEEWCVIPPSLKGRNLTRFTVHAKSALAQYCAMVEEGAKPEDARFILPEGTKTNLVVTMNMRQLFHVFTMRLDKHAQWEIRELSQLVMEALSKTNEELKEVMQMYIDNRGA